MTLLLEYRMCEWGEGFRTCRVWLDEKQVVVRYYDTINGDESIDPTAGATIEAAKIDAMIFALITGRDRMRGAR